MFLNIARNGRQIELIRQIDSKNNWIVRFLFDGYSTICYNLNLSQINILVVTLKNRQIDKLKDIYVNRLIVRLIEQNNGQIDRLKVTKR